MRALIRRIVPFGIRLELLRLRRLPRWLVEHRSMARRRPDLDPGGFSWLLAEHSSPLERTPGAVRPDLQSGKETNVGLAAGLIDGVVVDPCQTFSYHHVVGRPTRRRGFRSGLELRDQSPTGSTGGGLCQVSNSFYWVAVKAGMRIVERHRHGLDLFPDDRRTVPFGCGATVVYNYADLRFENALTVPVMLRSRVEDGRFVSEVWAAGDPGVRVDVEEVDHRFYRTAEGWMRENRLVRRISSPDGRLVSEHEVAHNVGRVLYEPAPDQQP